MDPHLKLSLEAFQPHGQEFTVSLLLLILISHSTLKHTVAPPTFHSPFVYRVTVKTKRKCITYSYATSVLHLLYIALATCTLNTHRALQTGTTVGNCSFGVIATGTLEIRASIRPSSLQQNIM